MYVFSLIVAVYRSSINMVARWIHSYSNRITMCCVSIREVMSFSWLVGLASSDVYYLIRLACGVLFKRF